MTQGNPVQNMAKQTDTSQDYDERPDLFGDADKGSPNTLQKFKQNPMVPIGIAGFVGCVAFAVHQFKKYKPKGTTSVTLYVTQFRVIAQSIAVGCITLGVGYSIIRDKFFKQTGSETSGTKK